MRIIQAVHFMELGSAKKNFHIIVGGGGGAKYFHKIQT